MRGLARARGWTPGALGLAAVTLLPALAMLAPLSAQQTRGTDTARAQDTSQDAIRTRHLWIHYPPVGAGVARSFAGYAEGIYADVDSLLGDALPETLTVNFVEQGLSRLDSGRVTLNLQQEPYLRQVFARELAYLAMQVELGPAYGFEGYRFLIEGVGAWVGERYERELGSVPPRRTWAAYAYVQEATYLGYLEAFERASEEIGKQVVTGVGYTFVKHLVGRHGVRAVPVLLRSLAENSDVCSALDGARFDCEAFVPSWEAALQAEAGRHDFTQLPQVEADLLVAGDGELLDLTLEVRIQNPEAESYLFFVSYVIGEERDEIAYPAESGDFRTQVGLGRARLGTKVLWDVAVWSRTLQLWRRSGWQDRTVR